MDLLAIVELPAATKVAGLAIAGVLGSAAFFGTTHRRERGSEEATPRLFGGPYRASPLAAPQPPALPLLVRAAVAAGVLLAVVFVPGFLFTLFKLRIDLALGLYPSIGMALLNARAAWLLLARPQVPRREAMEGAFETLIAHACLLGFVAAHRALGTSDGEARYDGPSPLVYVATSFAVAMIAQAALMLAARRPPRTHARHGDHRAHI